MKKTFTLIILIICISLNIYSQTPQAISYQAVARNAQGQILSNTNVSLQISILEGTATGQVIYLERHNVITNVFGLINLKIGEGTVQLGNFSQISWSSNLYFTKIEIDFTGGTNYIIIGILQMLSVPYAFHAETAKNVINGFSGNYDDLTNKPMDIYPRVAAKGQKVSVTFAGGDAVTFSQASNTCPNVWATASLRLHQGTSTIMPFDVFYIDYKRFDVIFDIPSYFPSGFYDIIIGPDTSCEQTINGAFKIK